MRRFLGAEFEGVISGVTGFGLFIELKRYPIEGLVPIASLGKEYFEFEEATLSLYGRNSGKVFRIGDNVTVVIEHIDEFKKEMDLRIL